MHRFIIGGKQRELPYGVMRAAGAGEVGLVVERSGPAPSAVHEGLVLLDADGSGGCVVTCAFPVSMHRFIRGISGYKK